MKSIVVDKVVYEDLKYGSLIGFTVHYENWHGDAMCESLHCLMKKYKLNSIREFNVKFEYVAPTPMVLKKNKTKGIKMKNEVTIKKIVKFNENIEFFVGEDDRLSVHLKSSIKDFNIVIEKEVKELVEIKTGEFSFVYDFDKDERIKNAIKLIATGSDTEEAICKINSMEYLVSNAINYLNKKINSI